MARFLSAVIIVRKDSLFVHAIIQHRDSLLFIVIINVDDTLIGYGGIFAGGSLLALVIIVQSGSLCVNAIIRCNDSLRWLAIIRSDDSLSSLAVIHGGGSLLDSLNVYVIIPRFDTLMLNVFIDPNDSLYSFAALNKLCSLFVQCYYMSI